MRDLPIIAYWHDTDHAKIEEFKSAWSPYFALKIMGDRDIIPLLRRYAAEYVDLYSKLRIPAAKSDIARLLALYDSGGFYVDCHIGFTNSDAVKDLIQRLQNRELVLFSRTTRDLPTTR
jgi:mannosyltransferase OCH1-like enzyme